MVDAAKAYENMMDGEAHASLSKKTAHHVTWDDLSEAEARQIGRQDTILRDFYFEVRDLDPAVTHDQAWSVIKTWDDSMLENEKYVEDYYTHEGNENSPNFTNPYDARVLWLQRVTGVKHYPLLREIKENNEADTSHP